ncbi:MAG: hypothetical protein ABI298_07170, partial [Acidimicrobiales bacterium]
MKLQRIALLAIVVLASIAFVDTGSRGATTTAPSGLPIYRFVDSGSGPLPWNASSLEGSINKATMLGGPHAASNATEGVLAFRTNKDQLGTYVKTATGTSTWTILSTPQNSLPTPSGDPIPFFDPSGNVDLLYVDNASQVILLSKNDPVNALWHNLRDDSAWRPYEATDLTALTGAEAANGLPSILLNGLSATVAYRTTTNTIEIAQLGWAAGQTVPFISSSPGAVTVAVTQPHPVTTTTKPVTTTTKPVTTTTKPVTTTTKPVTT